MCGFVVLFCLCVNVHIVFFFFFLMPFSLHIFFSLYECVLACAFLTLVMHSTERIYILTAHSDGFGFVHLCVTYFTAHNSLVGYVFCVDWNQWLFDLAFYWRKQRHRTSLFFISSFSEKLNVFGVVIPLLYCIHIS